MTINPKGAAFAAALVFAAPAADAAVLLTVDIADPLAVTINATGAASSIDVTGFLGNGFTLMGFVTGPVGAAAATASNLIAAGSSQPLQFRYVTSGAGLNLFLADPSNPTFSLDTVTAAFTGSATFDLSSFVLSPRGTIGDIRPGDGDFSPLGAVIGSYRVIDSSVPLPSAGLLLVLGLAAPAALARRRRS